MAPKAPRSPAATASPAFYCDGHLHPWLPAWSTLTHLPPTTLPFTRSWFCSRKADNYAAASSPCCSERGVLFLASLQGQVGKPVTQVSRAMWGGGSCSFLEKLKISINRKHLSLQLWGEIFPPPKTGEVLISAVPCSALLCSALARSQIGASVFYSVTGTSSSETQEFFWL